MDSAPPLFTNAPKLPTDHEIPTLANELPQARTAVDTRLPWLRTSALALQHVLAMYAGAVAVPLIVGAALGLSPAEQAFLVSADLFTSGIATLLQTIGIGRHLGIRLPVMLGVSFTAVGPMISIGKQLGLRYVYGAILCAGLFMVLVSGTFGRLRRFFPPVVTGSVVTVIGTTLIPVAMHWAAGGIGASDYGAPRHLGLSLFVLSAIGFIYHMGERKQRPFLSSIAVLLGLVLGAIVAFASGGVSLHETIRAPWLAITTPFRFGWPAWNPWAMLSMILVSVLCMVESIGVFMAISQVVGIPLEERDITRGLRAEGVAVLLGGSLNSFPYTTFSQNAGLVALSHVKSRFVVAAAGAMLIGLGLLPKFAALLAALPKSVLGGAGVAMFGMVAASGIRVLSEVNFRRSQNLFIVAVSLGLGLGVSNAPDALAELPTALRLLFSDGIVVGSLAAILLNIVLGEPHSVSRPKHQEESHSRCKTPTSQADAYQGEHGDL